MCSTNVVKFGETPMDRTIASQANLEGVTTKRRPPLKEDEEIV